MRESSLCNWHILPFCGFIWIIKKSLQMIFNSSSHYTHYLLLWKTQKTNLLKGHSVFHLPVAPAYVLRIVAPHQACPHILHRWQSWALDWSQPKPRGTNYSFSVQGKTYISEKLHEKCSFKKKQKNICSESPHTALGGFDWQSTASICHWHLAFSTQERSRGGESLKWPPIREHDPLRPGSVHQTLRKLNHIYTKT